MLVGVLSDTHDRLPTIRAALELFAARRVEAVASRTSIGIVP